MYLCSKYVFYPANFAEVKSHIYECNLAEILRCIGSIDTTHIFLLIRN